MLLIIFYRFRNILYVLWLFICVYLRKRKRNMNWLKISSAFFFWNCHFIDLSILFGLTSIELSIVYRDISYEAEALCFPFLHSVIDLSSIYFVSHFHSITSNRHLFARSTVLSIIHNTSTYILVIFMFFFHIFWLIKRQHWKLVHRNRNILVWSNILFLT